MKSFVLVSEEAISKGIRRIVALTGPEALKAENKCNALEERVENIQNLVQQKMKEGGLKIKETSQEISRIGEVSIFFALWHPDPVNITMGKFEEASFTFVVRPTIYIYASGKRSLSKAFDLKTPALRFIMNGKHFKTEFFENDVNHAIFLTEFSSKWPVIVEFSSFSSVV